jgi:uncharacterized protein YbcI
MKTKGETEAQISEAIVQFEIDYMGRGPKEVRSYIVEDMVLLRLKGVLTPAEQQLVKSSEGSELVKKMRATLIEKAKPLLFQVIGDITGSKIVNLYTDISTASDERVLMFELEQSLESQLVRKKGV